ncbi:hypothetical protein KAJ27_10135, partial [bacterium]|nr:hypothetical protein [bacterium]
LLVFYSKTANDNPIVFVTDRKFGLTGNANSSVTIEDFYDNGGQGAPEVALRSGSLFDLVTYDVTFTPGDTDFFMAAGFCKNIDTTTTVPVKDWSIGLSSEKLETVADSMYTVPKFFGRFPIMDTINFDQFENEFNVTTPILFGSRGIVHSGGHTYTTRNDGTVIWDIYESTNPLVEESTPPKHTISIYLSAAPVKNGSLENMQAWVAKEGIDKACTELGLSPTYFYGNVDLNGWDPEIYDIFIACDNPSGLWGDVNSVTTWIEENEGLGIAFHAPFSSGYTNMTAAWGISYTDIWNHYSYHATRPSTDPLAEGLPDTFRINPDTNMIALSNQGLLQNETFDTKQNSFWVYNQYHTVPYDYSGENVLQTSGQNSYAANCYRNGYVLQHGDVVEFDFMVNTTNTAAHFAIESSQGGYKRFCMISTGSLYMQYYNPAEINTWQYPKTLLTTKPDTWFSARITIDDNSGFRYEVWERDDPAVYNSFDYASAFPGGIKWRFHHWVYRHGA